MFRFHASTTLRFAYLLSVGNLLDGLASDEVVVDVMLHVGHLAADDLDQLGGQVLRVECVDSAEDELIHDGAHFVLLLEHLIALLLGRVRLAALQNWCANLPPEFLRQTQDAPVGEVDHGKELLEIILHGSSRQQDAASGASVCVAFSTGKQHRWILASILPRTSAKHNIEHLHGRLESATLVLV